MSICISQTPEKYLKHQKNISNTKKYISNTKKNISNTKKISQTPKKYLKHQKISQTPVTHRPIFLNQLDPTFLVSKSRLKQKSKIRDLSTDHKQRCTHLYFSSAEAQREVLKLIRWLALHCGPWCPTPTLAKWASSNQLNLNSDSPACSNVSAVIQRCIRTRAPH